MQCSAPPNARPTSAMCMVRSVTPVIRTRHEFCYESTNLQASGRPSQDALQPTPLLPKPKPNRQGHPCPNASISVMSPAMSAEKTPLQSTARAQV